MFMTFSFLGNYHIYYDSRDRIRTSVNVLGDSYGAGIVHHLSRHELLKQDQENAEREAREREELERQMIEAGLEAVDGRRASEAMGNPLYPNIKDQHSKM